MKKLKMCCVVEVCGERQVTLDSLTVTVTSFAMAEMIDRSNGMANVWIWTAWRRYD